MELGHSEVYRDHCTILVRNLLRQVTYFNCYDLVGLFTYLTLTYPTFSRPLTPFRSNSLYPSTLRSKIAYSNFKNICKTSPLFDALCKNLKEGNVQFFHDLLEKENTGFVFVVEAEFSANETNVHASMDFCNFPYLRRISASDLSQEQAESATRMKRNLGKEQPKLVTNFEPCAVLTNISENLLYLVVFNNLLIKRVLKIVSYNAYDYFNDYITRLQTHRRDAVSPILSKVVKSLGQ